MKPKILRASKPTIISNAVRFTCLYWNHPLMKNLPSATNTSAQNTSESFGSTLPSLPQESFPEHDEKFKLGLDGMFHSQES